MKRLKLILSLLLALAFVFAAISCFGDEEEELPTDPTDIDTNDVVDLTNGAPLAIPDYEIFKFDSNEDGYEVFHFDATGSIDSDGTIVSYEWKTNGALLGTAAIISNVSLPVGSNSIYLKVVDDAGDEGETFAFALVFTNGQDIPTNMFTNIDTNAYDTNHYDTNGYDTNYYDTNGYDMGTTGEWNMYMAGYLSVGMVKVDGGYTFPTGIYDDGSATVDTAYEIAETELTYDQWATVYNWATANGYVFKNPGRQGGSMSSGPVGNSDHPVTTINWEDAIVWCNAFTEYYNTENGTALSFVYTNGDGSAIKVATNHEVFASAGMDDTADGFRLPTSDEWELAARFIYDDGDKTLSDGEYYPGTFASGADSPYDQSPTNDFDANGFMLSPDAVSWNTRNSGNTTHMIATATNDIGYTFTGEPNMLYLYDMSGNVYEWVYDWREGQEGSQRAVRGGSWYDTVTSIRLGFESGLSVGGLRTGLRLARNAGDVSYGGGDTNGGDTNTSSSVYVNFYSYNPIYQETDGKPYDITIYDSFYTVVYSNSGTTDEGIDTYYGTSWAKDIVELEEGQTYDIEVNAVAGGQLYSYYGAYTGNSASVHVKILHNMYSNSGSVGGNMAPFAEAGDNITVAEGEGVSLDGSSSYDPDGTISSYTWSTNGVQITTGETPYAISLPQGTHTVTLTVADNYGETSTDTVTVTVTAPPSTNFEIYTYNTTYWETGSVEYTIVIRDTESNVVYSNDNTTTYGVDTYYNTSRGRDVVSLVDGALYFLKMTSADSTYTYEINAQQTFSSDHHYDLRYYFDHNRWVKVGTNQAPTANAGSDITVADEDDDGSEIISLDGSSSSDPDGSIVSYSWKTNDVEIANTQSASVSFPVGAHAVNLIVVDNNGASSTNSINVNVEAVQYTNFEIYTYNTTYGETGSVEYTIVIRDTESNVVYSNDNTTTYGVDTYYNTSRGRDVVSLIDGNLYYLKMTSADSTYTYEMNFQQTFGSDHHTDLRYYFIHNQWVKVGTNQAPTANAGSDITVTDEDDDGSETISLDGSSSSDPDGSIASYSWKTNDVEIANTQSASVSFPVGAHAVNLIVVDNDGASSTNSVNVTVEAVQYTNFTINTYNTTYWETGSIEYTIEIRDTDSNVVYLNTNTTTAGVDTYYNTSYGEDIVSLIDGNLYYLKMTSSNSSYAYEIDTQQTFDSTDHNDEYNFDHNRWVKVWTNSSLLPTNPDDFTFDVVDGTLRLTGYTGSDENIKVPSTIDGTNVTAMFDTFNGNTNITNVVIADTITSIESSVFLGCTSLVSVSIPEGVTNLGDYAFDLSSALESITIPSTVTAIGDGALRNCYSLTSLTIPANVTSLGMQAVDHCTNLSSVTVNATTPPTLGMSAFENNAASRKFYVPSASLTDYQTAWSSHSADIVSQ